MKVASTLSGDTAPSARPVPPGAPLAPPDPSVPPGPLGGVPSPPQPASGRPKVEKFSPFKPPGGAALMCATEWRLALLAVLLRAPLLTQLAVLAGRTVGLYGALQQHTLNQANAYAAEALAQPLVVAVHAARPQARAPHRATAAPPAAAPGRRPPAICPDLRRCSTSTRRAWARTCASSRRRCSQRPRSASRRSPLMTTPHNLLWLTGPSSCSTPRDLPPRSRGAASPRHPPGPLARGAHARLFVRLLPRSCCSTR